MPPFSPELPIQPQEISSTDKGARLLRALLGCGALGLVGAGIYAYLSVAGVVHLGLARIILSGVWLVAVVAVVVSEVVWGRGTKHRVWVCILAGILLAVIFVCLDRWAIKHRPEAPKFPSPTEIAGEVWKEQPNNPAPSKGSQGDQHQRLPPQLPSNGKHQPVGNHQIDTSALAVAMKGFPQLTVMVKGKHTHWQNDLLNTLQIVIPKATDLGLFEDAGLDFEGAKVYANDPPLSQNDKAIDGAKALVAELKRQNFTATRFSAKEYNGEDFEKNFIIVVVGNLAQ